MQIFSVPSHLVEISVLKFAHEGSFLTREKTRVFSTLSYSTLGVQSYGINHYQQYFNKAIFYAS